MADASSPPPAKQCDVAEGSSALSEEMSSANEAIEAVPPLVDASIARPSVTEFRRPPTARYSSDGIRHRPVSRIPNGCIRRPPPFCTGMPRGFIGDWESHMYDDVRCPNWHGPSPWGFNGWPSSMQVVPGVPSWPCFHPPIHPAPFMYPPCPAPFPPFAAPVRFPEAFHHGHSFPPRPRAEPFRRQPFRTQPPSSSSFLPENLRTSLLKQIEYYFSVENLCKDVYLRRMMDEQGWVPGSLIASFNRVKKITSDVHCILDVLMSSRVVEVKDGRIRKREDWQRWVLTPQNDQQMESIDNGMQRLGIN